MKRKAARSRSNPQRGQLIYSRLGSITAQKDPTGKDGHPCGAACKRAGHWYRHEFKNGSKVYGFPDGTLMIRKGAA